MRVEDMAVHVLGMVIDAREHAISESNRADELAEQLAEVEAQRDEMQLELIDLREEVAMLRRVNDSFAERIASEVTHG
jgi:uncharacterized coiled-coil DUF342 family protein